MIIIHVPNLPYKCITDRIRTIIPPINIKRLWTIKIAMLGYVWCNWSMTTQTPEQSNVKKTSNGDTLYSLYNIGIRILSELFISE